MAGQIQKQRELLSKSAKGSSCYNTVRVGTPGAPGPRVPRHPIPPIYRCRLVNVRNRPQLLTDSDRVTLCRIRKREKASLKKCGLLTWQADMLAMCASGDHEVLLVSAPRGSGKSMTCARLVLESLVRGGKLHEPRAKVLLVAASRTQAGLILEALVGLDGADAIQVGLTGAKGDDGASCRILGSDSRRAQGLGGERLVICDEPGAWLPSDGPRLWSALTGAAGKRDKRTMIAVGTRAPAGPTSWWPQLLEQPLPERWTKIDLHAPDPGNWIGVLKANRFAAAHPTGPMYAVLKREFLNAQSDPTARQQFVADRCNGYLAVPGARVLDDDELAQVLARPAGDVAVDATQSVVGLDMGANLSMSGVALFSPISRRIDLFAVAPPVSRSQARSRVAARSRYRPRRWRCYRRDPWVRSSPTRTGPKKSRRPSRRAAGGSW